MFAHAPAQADVVTLTFEGVRDGGLVGSFYDGGPGGQYGIVFDAAATATVDRDAGGGGFFANEPSPSTVLYFGENANTRSAYVNVNHGFQDRVTFSYSQPFDPGQPGITYSHFRVAVFEGFGGTGQELGGWALPSTNPSAPGDPTGGLFGHFIEFNESFQGVGHSLGFFDERNPAGAVFDDLKFDLAPATPIPEPTSLLLVGAGGIGLATRRVRNRLFSGPRDRHSD
jgi:hypothetical protein